MPTSGSTDYVLNARQVVTHALKILRVVAASETPSAEDMEDSIEALNLMLKSWQMTMPNLWRRAEGSVSLVSATASYVLASAYRIESARFRQNGRDLPMELLTRDEYQDMPLKTTLGIPTQYYFDPQRATGTLYVWPVLAAAAGETIQYTYQRRFEDIDSANDDIDIPQEYLQTVAYNLAENLLDIFGKDDATARRVMLKAGSLRTEMQMADREDVVRFVPG